MKGIVLAGGSGTRLYPMTSVLNKHLLPVYDKPMIYYPLSILMMAGVRDVLIISSPEDLPFFRDLLGDGKRFGIKLTYAVQPAPEGLAQAFIIGREFVGKDDVAMILGDNIFFGNAMKEKLTAAIDNVKRGKATIFGYHVPNPERFGVIEFDKAGRVLSIEEKPKRPRSNYAAAGLYFYDNRVIEFARRVRPSWRNELEITDINSMYLEAGDLEAIPLGRGFSWMDAGTPESLAEASSLIRMIERHQGLKVACLEEIALRNGWVGREELERIAESYGNSDYGKYISKILQEGILY
ncbi:MAG: glucose-1-phosphate thymidylyltransferase RfbA [Methanomassiliicoccales archaeon]|nr:glucose-1-phosphate thymidylyltransferase RfbA [Methanomassiliicoccales archaeon]